jgi:malate/lactate dehydrogenase
VASIPATELIGEEKLNAILEHQSGPFVGGPVKLGKGGITDLIELKLNADEMALLEASSAAVKSVMDVYDGMGL